MQTNASFQVWLKSLSQTDSNGYSNAVATQLRRSSIECLQNPSTTDRKNILVVLDDQSSESEVLELLKEVLDPNRRVIVLYSGNRKLPFFHVWRLLSMGVDDVLLTQEKNRIDEIIHARLKRWSIIDKIVESDKVQKTLIGSCPQWRKTLRQIVEVACFSQAPVLILGESGTGKELVARLIHDLDKRPNKQGLTLLDCTTIVPELSGSEFFGHEKGAFTNAVANRDGAFALADGGTLFLDEIGELPMRLQAELLRVSQDGLYKKVGSNIWKNTQFRLVCATNRNLLQEVERGHFRQDLYYRLSTCIIQLPPLRERKMDIPELASHFLAQILKTSVPPVFDSFMLNFLMAHSFPGNVRQLRQLVTRIAYRYAGEGPVTIGDIPDVDREHLSFSADTWQENGFKDAIRQALSNGVGLKDIKRITADVAMGIAIDEASGNLQEAARRLDVTDRLVQGYLAGKRGNEDGL